jgi:hypothetical protein
MTLIYVHMNRAPCSTPHVFPDHFKQCQHLKPEISGKQTAQVLR